MALRESVLKALKAGNGEWVSGETLSQTLNVSRTAVWKQVQNLSTEGYKIESSPKKGYRISNPVDLLSPEEVKPGLLTEVFGQDNYFYYRQTDSTNKRARALANDGYPEGTVIVAEEQTDGRGRRGRSWYSPSNQGIYMSIILRPAFPLRQISRLSLLAGVASAEALKDELGLQPSIKWPNDILINGRKITGILSEAVTDMDSIEYIVLGIGININNLPQEFPEDFRTPPTSVLAENGQPGSRVKLLRKLLLSLERQYNFLEDDNFTPILEKARRLSMTLGQKVYFDEGSEVISGEAIDLDDKGYLLVRDYKGTIHTVMSGEISLLS
ncbi:MAG TPA: biotin--[acetyl-CoA-carboxylase] ligase [Syntrophomonadaceae bacterium]|nr:biotin--[acetyl-CoA-carboxylase] ligase [Syntrophomonadaceae bacterium]HPR93482.1 biotin--[acetyl-CoA-carboxylase] ligase [Syntrophomonadaceae bacterium]